MFANHLWHHEKPRSFSEGVRTGFRKRRRTWEKSGSGKVLARLQPTGRTAIGKTLLIVKLNQELTSCVMRLKTSTAPVKFGQKSCRPLVCPSSFSCIDSRKRVWDQRVVLIWIHHRSVTRSAALLKSISLFPSSQPSATSIFLRRFISNKVSSASKNKLTSASFQSFPKRDCPVAKKVSGSNPNESSKKKKLSAFNTVRSNTTCVWCHLLLHDYSITFHLTFYGTVLKFIFGTRCKSSTPDFIMQNKQYYRY